MLFVHSPLLGPSSWARAAALARATGWQVSVPDLASATASPSPSWTRVVEQAVVAGRSLAGTVAVVGHSGAGPMLPAITAGLFGQDKMTVFVDAAVPPIADCHRPTRRQLQMHDQQTAPDGFLMNWLDWWSDDVVQSLLPSVDDRAVLSRDMPSVPRVLYDEAVPVPRGWVNAKNAYLRLSSSYEPQRQFGIDNGWATAKVDGDHLSIFTDASTVLAQVELLIELLSQ